MHDVDVSVALRELSRTPPRSDAPLGDAIDYSKDTADPAEPKEKSLKPAATPHDDSAKSAYDAALPHDDNGDASADAAHPPGDSVQAAADPALPLDESVEGASEGALHHDYNGQPSADLAPPHDGNRKPSADPAQPREDSFEATSDTLISEYKTPGATKVGPDRFCAGAEAAVADPSHTLVDGGVLRSANSRVTLRWRSCSERKPTGRTQNWTKRLASAD